MIVPHFIDSHTHLDAEAFNPDREEVIQRAIERGVTRMITIGAGYGVGSAYRAIALAERYPCIYASVGIHPLDAECDVDPSSIEELCRHPRVVAVGETGLDLFKGPSLEVQERWFRAQIGIARRVKKPLIIHSREAGEQCYQILSEEGAKEVGGVFHCFAEDEHFAERLIAIQFLVSFPGTITFKKADALRDVVAAIPLERIMVETDAPYMSPDPNRGKRCEPSFVVDTAAALARIKKVSLEEVSRVTNANAERLFGLPDGCSTKPPL